MFPSTADASGSISSLPTRQLRDALAHLYDHAYLERHPLAARLARGSSGTRTRAQETRRILLNAIELLNPGDNWGLRSLERRAYAVLFGLYVEGHDMPTVAQSLGISSRQLRRDRAAALESLAALLEDRYLTPAEEGQPHGPLAEDPLHQESFRLAEQQECVYLEELADSLFAILDSLARANDVRLRMELPAAVSFVRANPTLLRQLLLSLGSHAIAHVQPHCLTLAAQTHIDETGVTSLQVGWHLQWSTQTPATFHLKDLFADPDTPATLAAALGGHLQVEPGAQGDACLWLELSQGIHRTVLVIDDNHDLLELFRRYLTGHPYLVQSASSVDEGLALVQRSLPDAIVLDLMMPGRDGWEALAALRRDPALTAVPVIICSVLHEPELAHAMGAQCVLKKPVGAPELLAALEAVLPGA